MAGREGLLQHKRHVVAAAVLEVKDTPGPHRRPACALHQGKDPPRVVDVGGLIGNQQHRIDALHRHHAHHSSQRTIALAAERDLQGRRRVLRVAHGHRQQRIGLAGQGIDVEGADQADQRLPRGGIADDDQRIAVSIGGDLAAGLNKRLQDLGEFGGRGIAQRHRGIVPPTKRRRLCGGRYHPVNTGGLDHGGAVGGKQRLQQPHELSPCQGCRRMQCGHSVHCRIDRVIDMEDVAEDLRRHLPYVGVGEVQGDLTQACRVAGQTEGQGGRRRGAGQHRRDHVRSSHRAVHPRWGGGAFARQRRKRFQNRRGGGLYAPRHSQHRHERERHTTFHGGSPCLRGDGFELPAAPRKARSASCTRLEALTLRSMARILTRRIRLASRWTRNWRFPPPSFLTAFSPLTSIPYRHVTL